jgi:hypothetical protein
MDHVPAMIGASLRRAEARDQPNTRSSFITEEY